MVGTPSTSRHMDSGAGLEYCYKTMSKQPMKTSPKTTDSVKASAGKKKPITGAKFKRTIQSAAVKPRHFTVAQLRQWVKEVRP
jgi:hypothetical protein